MERVSKEMNNKDVLETFPNKRRRKRPEIFSNGDRDFSGFNNEQNDANLNDHSVQNAEHFINLAALIEHYENGKGGYCTKQSLHHSNENNSKIIQNSSNLLDKKTFVLDKRSNSCADGLHGQSHVGLKVFQNVSAEDFETPQIFRRNVDDQRPKNNFVVGGGSLKVKQSFGRPLFGTVRIKSLSHSVGRIFPLPNETENGEENTKFLEAKTVSMVENDKLEDEGIEMIDSIANLFRRDYFLSKQNPGYLSDTEDDKESKISESAVDISPIANDSISTTDATFDEISLTSEYDSISTASVESTNQLNDHLYVERSNKKLTKKMRPENVSKSCGSATKQNISRLSFHAKARSSPISGPIVTLRCLSKNSTGGFQTQANQTSTSDNPNGLNRLSPDFKISSNPKTLLTNNETDTDNKQNNFPAIDKKTLQTFQSKENENIKTNSNLQTDDNKHERSIEFLQETSTESKLTTLVKGQVEVKVKETEKITTARLTARSSKIFKKREKLTSMASQIAQEFEDGTRPQPLNNEPQTSGTSLTIANQQPPPKSTTLLGSKFTLDGIEQNIRVERENHEIHVISGNDQKEANSGHIKSSDSVSPSEAGCEAILKSSCNNVVYTDVRPTPGSTSREFVEIFLNATKCLVEMNNVVCCQTVVPRQNLLNIKNSNIYATLRKNNAMTMAASLLTSSLPSTALKSLVNNSNDKEFDWSRQQTLQDGKLPLGCGDIYKVTSVYLIRTTLIDMNSSVERRKYFQDLLSTSKATINSETNRIDSDGSHGNSASGATVECQTVHNESVSNNAPTTYKLSEDQHAMFFEKLKNLADVEGPIV